MALLALHGVHFRSHAKPGKNDIGYFDSEIQLDNAVFQPYGRIRGKFIVNTNNEVVCHGIRVQLDATVNLKFDTKVDNRVSTNKKLEGLLQDSAEPGEGYYIRSPIREDLALNNDEELHRSRTIVLQPGTYTYPFELSMPGEILPTPFRSQYGNLQYKIVVYMASSYCYIQVAEKPLRFRGYNNLSQIPNYLEPIKHESGFQKSMFSSKKVITAVLQLEKRGYLPGEDVSFTLSIINPKSFVVRKISVNLVRRVIYNVNGAIKTTLVNLDSFENSDISKDDEIYCKNKVNVPRNCMPSYNIKSVYSVIHLLQYQVKVSEFPGPLKGQVEVIIGTTKDSIEMLMTRRMSMLTVDVDHYGCGGSPTHQRERSGSIASHSSTMTTISLPPPYSQLSSRAMSLLSLDTLPPHYDDLT